MLTEGSFEVRRRIVDLERFPAKRIPVRVKKTRQNKRLELRSDSIGTEKALASHVPLDSVELDGAIFEEKNWREPK